MKIEINNFRGLSIADIEVPPGLTVIAGPNGTSLAEAVRFAMIKSTGPVEKIKDLPALLHRGAKKGHVSIHIDGLHVKRMLPTGKADAEPELYPAMSITTGAITLAQLKVAERQSLVSEIGIPARLSAQAVEPINAKLGDCPWPVTMDQDDFGLRLDGRPYHMLSESERWRCDAAFAVAAAQTGGANLVILDRYDVLDADGRREAHRWLREAALETGYVLLIGTLSPELAKQLNAVWIG
jgi:hypothetical protein